MKLLNKGIICLSVGTALLAVSCADESPWGASSATDGKIELHLQTDEDVMIGTRATEEDGKAMVPEVSKFSVALQKSDGSYNKTWQSLDAFHNESGFPQGTYTISAFYGDKDTEGFEKPFYYGEGDVIVKLGETTAQTVTTSLNNAMLSIRYSDQLKEMFPNRYSSSVQTDGHSPVVYAYNEERPAYLCPGDANVFITLTNDKNETVNLNTVTVNLSAKHHYIMTVGVKMGDSGSQSLDVQITEDITVTEPIEIILSDDLFSSPSPTVDAVNFESGLENQIFDSFADTDKEPELHVVALGGIKSAVLTLTSDTSIPVFGGTNYSVDLVNTDENTQAKLNQTGLKGYGFNKNSDKMAVLNLQDYIKNLPEGNHTVSLIVTDNKGKTSQTEEDLVVYKVKVIGLAYELSSEKKPKFMEDKITVTITTNCEDLKDNFTFYATNSNGEIAEVIKAIFKSEKKNADNNIEYTYELTVDSINDCEWVVKAQYADKKSSDITLDVDMPEFEVETDAFAKRVKIKIKDVKNTALSASDLIKYLNIKNNNADIQSTYIDRSNSEDEIIVVTGLNPKNSTVNNQNFNGEYSNMVLYLGKKINSKYTGVQVPTFTTEEALDVPNGDFTQKGNRFYFEEILSGGLWHVPLSSWYKYHNVTSIDVYEPLGWASLNDLTCWASSDPLNTWFVVPSTILQDNNSVLIRTVGYNHSGVEPAIDNTVGQTSGNGYNTKAPSSDQFIVTAGELFLGSYDFDLDPKRVDGSKEINSRPNYMLFDYKFEGRNQEKGIAEIIVYSEDGRVISSSSIEIENGENNNFKLNLPDYKFGEKGDKIFISFRSSNSANPDINIPSGSELKVSHNALRTYGSVTNGGAYRIISGDYKALATGSELTISNVKLIYE